MDNSRIMSGYNLEFQASAAFFKKLLQKTVTEFLPKYKDKLKNEKIVPLIPFISQLKVTDTTLLSDNNGNPCIHFTANLAGMININLMLVLKRVYGNAGRHISVSLILENDIDIMIFKYKAQTLIEDYAVKIPDKLLSNVSGEFRMRFVPGNAEYEPVICVMANLKLKDASVSPEGDMTKAVSFLPKGKEYTLGFNSNTYELFEEIIDEEVRTSAEDKPEASISKVKLKIGDQVLKIVVDGVYDVDGLIDSLDPKFTITTSISFAITDGFVDVQCNTSTKIKDNVFVSLLGALAGLYICPIFGPIIGLHANSFIKIAAKGIFSKVSDQVNSGFSADTNHGYYQKRNIALMHRRNRLVTHLNCMPNEPIPLFKYSSGNILYDYNYALQLNYSDICVNSDGLSVIGSLSSIDPYVTCNNVDLIDLKYASNDSLISLTYKNDEGETITLTESEAYSYLSESERISYYAIDENASGPVRDMRGKLPLVMLPKPTAMKMKDGAIYEFEFPNGLVGKAKNLVELYEKHILHIDGVEVVGRESGHYFRTLKDDIPDNNLGVLPKIEFE